MTMEKFPDNICLVTTGPDVNLSLYGRETNNYSVSPDNARFITLTILSFVYTPVDNG